jgi:hypothetical protein
MEVILPKLLEGTVYGILQEDEWAADETGFLFSRAAS